MASTVRQGSSSETSLSLSQGRYHCKFIDSIDDAYKCKVCDRVAVELVLLGCCGEHACKACVSPPREAGKPCPCCQDPEVTFLPHVKYRKAILALQVCCSMDERGCKWNGKLQDLEAHLDADSESSCKHIDIQCPNKCGKMMVKYKLSDHFKKHCPKRDYNCRYCGFTGSYEVVCDNHYPECDSYPIPCPNSCTVVSIERGTLEIHLEMCPYEEVECSFSYAGCGEKIKREKLDEHMSKNVQQHLLMLSSVTMHLSKQLAQKNKESGEKDRQIKAMTMELQALKNKGNKQQSDSMEAVTTNKEIEKQIRELKQSFQFRASSTDARINSHNFKISELSKCTATLETVTFRHTFLLPNLKREKEAESEWFSPPMYTHPGGYKFSININPHGSSSGKHLAAYFCQLMGEFDDSLKWPATVEFTLTLHNNQCKGNWFNVARASALTLVKQSVAISVPVEIDAQFATHRSMLAYYASSDCLYFSVSNISVV